MELPAGATPLDVEDFFAAIGELYFQVRTMRKAIQQMQASTRSNGAALENADVVTSLNRDAL